MSEQEFETYLDRVCDRLGLSDRRRGEVRDELRDHLDEQWERIGPVGPDRQQRIDRVLSEFGPADRLARDISRPYRQRTWRVAGLVAASLLMTLVLQMHLRSPGQARSPRGVGQADAGSLAGAGSELALLGLAYTSTPDAARQALTARLASVSFDSLPLEEVFDELRRLTEVNIWVNWRALESFGVDRDLPVTIKLKDVTFGRVLDLLCTELSEDDVIAFGHADNLIEISSVSMLRTPRPDINTVQMVYDVRAVIDAAEIRRKSLASARARHAEKHDATFPAQPSDPGVAIELCEIVRTTVAPDIWATNGGTQGSIEHFAGLLVVRAPESVQARVADLLEQLQANLGATPSGRDAVGRGRSGSGGAAGGATGQGMGGGRSESRGGGAGGRSR